MDNRTIVIWDHLDDSSAYKVLFTGKEAQICCSFFLEKLSWVDRVAYIYKGEHFFFYDQKDWKVVVEQSLFLYPSNRINLPYHFNVLIQGDKVGSGCFTVAYNAVNKIVISAVPGNDHDSMQVAVVRKKNPAVIRVTDIIGESNSPAGTSVWKIIEQERQNNRIFIDEKNKNTQARCHRFFPELGYKANCFIKMSKVFTKKRDDGYFEISAMKKFSKMTLEKFLLSKEFLGMRKFSLSLFALSLALLRAFEQQILRTNKAHCDIKLDNIMIDVNEYGEIKIQFIDVENAVVFGSFGSGHHPLLFTAPEIYYKREITERSDVHSLGRVLSVVWGASEIYAFTVNELIKLYESETVVLPNLFDGVAEDLKEEDKVNIKTCISAMLSPYARKRPFLCEVISSFEKWGLEYYIQFSLQHDSNAKQAKKLEIELREVYTRSVAFIDFLREELKKISIVNIYKGTSLTGFQQLFNIQIFMMKHAVKSKESFLLFKQMMSAQCLSQDHHFSLYLSNLCDIVTSFFESSVKYTKMIKQFYEEYKKDFPLREPLTELQKKQSKQVMLNVDKSLDGLQHYSFSIDLLHQANQKMQKQMRMIDSFLQQLRPKEDASHLVFESSPYFKN